MFVTKLIVVPEVKNEKQIVRLFEFEFISVLYVTCNAISVIYVTAQMCRRIEEKVAPTVGLPTP